MNTTEIIQIPRGQLADEVTPMSILQLAMSQNADIDKLTRLMELQFKWEENNARKAYHAAMAEFKKNPPQIEKNKHVRFDTSRGTTEYDHATLDHICDQIIPALAAVGITHKWKPSDQSNGEITITCTLTHELGYSDPEPPSLRGPLDTSGSKNGIQSIGSSTAYLERYTFLAAVGMAPRGRDNDGCGAEPTQKPAPDPIRNAASLDELLKAYTSAYRAAQEANDKSAIDAIVKAKDIRKKELQCN